MVVCLEIYGVAGEVRSTQIGCGALFAPTLEPWGEELRFGVQGDRPGLLTSAAGKCLVNMRLRLSEVGGRLAIGARSGGGEVVDGASLFAGASARA